MMIRKRNGFTLIELIIVMVIIAIGVTLMVPSMGTWLSNYRLRAVACDITSTLRSANMKAVSSNLEYRVYFNENETYWTERGNQSSNSNNWVGTTDPDNAAREGVINDFPTGVKVSLTGPFFIEFNPDSTCNAATITITNSKGKQFSITLIPSTGKVNVKS